MRKIFSFGISNILALLLSAQTVYIAVFEFNGTKCAAKYRKNEVAVVLTDGIEAAQARSIAVQNGDGYVAGAEKKESVWIAKYWENGTATILPDGTNGAETTSIFITD